MSTLMILFIHMKYLYAIIHVITPHAQFGHFVSCLYVSHLSKIKFVANFREFTLYVESFPSVYDFCTIIIVAHIAYHSFLCRWQ